MAINGDWILHFDWDCIGNYNQAGITFNSDGTFSVPSEGNTGKWVQNEGTIQWQYDTVKTTYGGNFVKNAMVGIMSTFAGLNGCWYAIRAGSTTMKAEEAKPEFNTSGQKAKQ